MTAEKKPVAEGTQAAAPRLLEGSTRGLKRQSLGSPGSLPGGLADDPVADPARELMLAAQAGDREAFRGLVEMFQDRVMRLMVSVLRCERTMAEDLTQEVFLRVYKGLPSFDGQVRFHTWLHTIGMNVAISEYRKGRAQKRNRPTVSLDAPVAATEDFYLAPEGREVDPAERAHQTEFLARVRECVAELPEEFRTAVVMRDMESLSYDEIAEVLDVPAGTVRSRIHRGRLMLQQMLKEFVQ